MRPGESFKNADVAECYRFRPEYPDDIYNKLVGLSRRKNSVLDLGCGTGKIARRLHKSFRSVTAIDASLAMLEVAKELPGGDSNNITWNHGLAESIKSEGPFDLIVAAASIHWMDHSVLFPRLLEVANADHIFANVNGDGAHQPPWDEPWDEFLSRWIFILRGEQYEPRKRNSEFEQYMTEYRNWINVLGNSTATRNVIQSIDQFIMCQHSRDTFAPSKLGSQIGQFDEELREILEPHADGDRIVYQVQTQLEWGRIKPSP